MTPTPLPTLSLTQTEVLQRAINCHAGQVLSFPPKLKGGACKIVLASLAKQGFITAEGDTWRVTAAAYQIMQVPDPMLLASSAPTVPPAVTASLTPQRYRPGSKLAQMEAALLQEAGATLAQLMNLTQWQAHTVRGTLARVFKQQTGYRLHSHKAPAGERIYTLRANPEPHDEAARNL